MNNRALLGGAVIVALATVLWYVTLGPSRGGAVAPNQGVRIALSATAAGDGSWVRYLVSAKNLADGTFDGDVLLIDQNIGGTAPATPAISSVARNPSVVTVPEVAGQSSYRVHLVVPSRTSRTFAVLAPDFFGVVEALMGGQALDIENVDRPADIPVAVLSDSERTGSTLLGIRYDAFTLRVADYGLARDFPSTALQLAGYATVVIDQLDTTRLSGAQVQALRDFVGFGGTLVLAGGSDWRRVIAPLPADLLPLRPTSSAIASLAPVAALAGAAAPDIEVPVAAGTLAPAARQVLAGADGAPLVAELDLGLGRVVELAFDPSEASTTGTPYAALGWGQALARSINEDPGVAPVATTMLGVDPAFTALLPAADDAPLPPLWLMAIVMLLYVGLAGPLAYRLVRVRWNRPALMWVAIPLVALTFTTLFYGIGSVLQGSLQDHEIQVLRAGPDQSMNVLEYHRILFLRRGDHVIQLPADTLGVPLTLETYRTTGTTCERCSSQLGGLPAGFERALPSSEPSVEESGVVYGSVRVVAASGLSHRTSGLVAQLAIHGGRVQGTLANPTGAPVAMVTAFSSDGTTMHRADLAVVVPPGDQAQIDAPLQADNAQGSSAEMTLLRAVAASSLNARGQIDLVGLTAPLSSRLMVDGTAPPRAGLAVIEQAVPVTGADSSLRDVERKWLTSMSGTSATGFTDVYDLVAPASGPVSLTYDPQWSPVVEVYDWARGAFVAAPAGGHAALTADEVRGGMARARLHEPRLSWASTLWLDPPS